MEFFFDVNSLLLQEITKLAGKNPSTKLAQNENEKLLSVVVDAIGVASSKAQGLLHPVTTFLMLNTKKEVIYILKGNGSNDRGVVLGFLKTGRRKLFLNDMTGCQYEVVPLCLLDIYIHESRQRHGFGKKLFDAMLKEENVKPFEVAIDRPSLKLLEFLKKHYGLHSHINQSNYYVVFNKFFNTCKNLTRKSGTTAIPPITAGTTTIPPITAGITAFPPIIAGTTAIPPITAGTTAIPPITAGTTAIPPITATNKTSTTEDQPPPKSSIVLPPIVPLSSELAGSGGKKLPSIKVGHGGQKNKNLWSSNVTTAHGTYGHENFNYLSRSNIATNKDARGIGRRRIHGSTDIGSGIFKGIYGNGSFGARSNRASGLGVGSTSGHADFDIAPFLNMRQKKHHSNKSRGLSSQHSLTWPSHNSTHNFSKDHYSRHKREGDMQNREPATSKIKNKHYQNKE